MKPQTYDRITNSSLVVAIASALFFERAGNFSWLVGVFGIVAGVTAAGAYFYNQWCSQDKKDANFKGKEAASDELGSHELLISEQGPSSEQHVASTLRDVYEYARLGVPRERMGALFLYLPTSAVAAPGLGLVIADQILREIHRRPSARFVDEVVDIVNRLSSAGENPSYEFSLTRDGILTIRHLGRIKASRERAQFAFEENEALSPLPITRPN